MTSLWPRIRRAALIWPTLGFWIWAAILVVVLHIVWPEIGRDLATGRQTSRVGGATVCWLAAAFAGCIVALPGWWLSSRLGRMSLGVLVAVLVLHLVLIGLTIVALASGSSRHGDRETARLIESWKGPPDEWAVPPG